MASHGEKTQEKRSEEKMREYWRYEMDTITKQRDKKIRERAKIRYSTLP